MRPINEYAALLKQVLYQASQMVDCLPESHTPEALEVLGFIKQYGCHGMPSGEDGVFAEGPWLTRPGRPAKQYYGITVVPCFSNDVPPLAMPDQACAITPGRCVEKEQAILLYSVDHWSLPELALTFLHEARHARHRLGPRLAGLPPLDSEHLHEPNTWMFTLNMLTSWGGSRWAQAVQREVEWLRLHGSKAPQGHLAFRSSGCYWQELDQTFGPTKYQNVRVARRQLAAVHANVQFWSSRMGVAPEQVCQTIVSSFKA